MARVELAVGIGTGTSIALREGDRVIWGLRYGVNPVIGEIQTSRSRAQEIYEASAFAFPPGGTVERGRTVGPLSIFATPSSGPAREFQNLYAIRFTAGDDPKLARVTITDSRFWWPYTLVERAYNVPRNSGNLRLNGSGLGAGQNPLVPIQNQEVLPDKTYRRVSLVDPSDPDSPRWTAAQALADVMNLLAPSNYQIPPNVVAQSFFSDGVSLRDNGAAALARLLSFIPGVQPFQNEAGEIRFGNIYDGSEGVVAQAYRGQQNSGSVEFAERGAQRSNRFKVYFPIEPEVRFDFSDVGGEADPGGTIEPGREPPIAENVIPNPLLQLPLDDQVDDDGNPSGQIATLGEYVPLPKFIEAFNRVRSTKDMVGLSPAPLSQEFIRQVYMGRWEKMRSGFALISALKTYDAEMMSLVTALQSHWRSTFRLDSRWVDKLRALTSRRSAVMDPENAVRAKSPVFTNWIQVFAKRAFVGAEQSDLQFKHPDWAEDLRFATQSPFDVRVLDSDSGVISIVPRVHPRGFADDYLIGDTRESTTRLIGAALGHYANVTLLPGFKLSFILSAVLDSPNSRQRLWGIEVSLAEAAARLGVATPSSASGPDYETAIQLDTARFAWVDSRRDEILSAIFGPRAGEEPESFPPDLLVNGPVLNDLALSTAASVLSSTLDRWQGSLVVSHLPAIEPTGNLREVSHTITNTPTGAVATTTLNFPGEVEPLNVEALLPEQTRRVLRQEVSP